MTFEPGTRLGPYEIVRPLGAGGMGEVYEARDPRLRRLVAIKVLPAHLRTDADLLARFHREARALSSLSHPHVCSVYDVGCEGEIDFLVMERLEGETCQRRLEQGAMPFDEALHAAVEIAHALEAVHRCGIVHRDLKPGNVMLTRSGAKLLDFGLARRRAVGTPGHAVGRTHCHRTGYGGGDAPRDAALHGPGAGRGAGGGRADGRLRLRRGRPRDGDGSARLQREEPGLARRRDPREAATARCRRCSP